jgi:hypothetical protein
LLSSSCDALSLSYYLALPTTHTISPTILAIGYKTIQETAIEFILQRPSSYIPKRSQGTPRREFRSTGDNNVCATSRRPGYCDLTEQRSLLAHKQHEMRSECATRHLKLASSLETPAGERAGLVDVCSIPFCWIEGKPPASYTVIAHSCTRIKWKTYKAVLQRPNQTMNVFLPPETPCSCKSCQSSREASMFIFRDIDGKQGQVCVHCV